MATEALQIDALWSGLMSSTNGKAYSGAIIGTFAADGTTPKAVWEDKEKTLPTGAGKSQFTLDSSGAAEVFGDGVYVIEVYAPTDTLLSSPLRTLDGLNYNIGVTPEIFDQDHNTDGSHIVYTSVANLRAATLTPFDGQIIKLTGYSTVGDAPLVHYRWGATSVATDNGWSVIKDSDIVTGRWILTKQNPAYLENAGLVGDGIVNDSTSLQALANAIPAGTKVISESGKTYLIETTVTFGTQLELGGFGTFETGTGVGNTSTLIFTEDDTIIKDITVIGDLRNSDGSPFDGSEDFATNVKWTIEVSGNNSIVKNIKSSNSVRDIVFNGSSGGSVSLCKIVNGTVGAGDGLGTYGAAISVSGGSSIKIHGNDINGNIQGVLVRGTSSRCKIYANNIKNTDDNTVYLSSGTLTQVFDNDLYNFDGTGIKMRGSYNKAHDNRITAISSGSTSGVSVTGSGAVDATGYNGYGNIVHHNTIDGDFDIAIYFQDLDGDSHSEWQCTNNIMKLAIATGVQTNYAIQVAGIGSDGCKISDNQSTGHVYGLITQADTGKDFENMDVSNNIFPDATVNGMNLDFFKNSIISNNNCSGTLNWALNIESCTFNTMSNNNLSDSNKGCRETGSSSDNKYFYNDITGVSAGNEYLFANVEATLEIKKISVQSLAGDITLSCGEADIYDINPGAAPRNLNITATEIWAKGFSITIANVGAQNLVFDSTGVNQTLAAGKVGVFHVRGYSAQPLFTVVSVY